MPSLIRICLLLSLFVVVFSVGCGVQEPDPAPTAVRIWQARDSLATAHPALWPDFDPRGLPLAVVHDSSTWLFDHPDPGPEFDPVTGTKRTFHRSGRDERVTANTSVDWNGTATTTLLLDGTEPDSVPGWAAVAVHEAFHVFQRERLGEWQANEASLFDYPFTDDNLLTWQLAEAEALRTALRYLGDDDLASAVRHAGYAVRARQRFNEAAPDFAREYVRLSELGEGIPFYLEQRLRNADGEIMFSRAPRLGADDLRRRAYYVGAGKAFLLDQLLPDWKRQLMRQAGSRKDPSLTDLLRSAVTRNGGVPDTLPKPLSNDSARRAASLVSRYKRDLSQLLRQFEREPGYQIVIDASAAPLFPTGFDPMNMQRLPDDRVLHTRWVVLSNARAEFEALDQLVLTTPAGDHPLYQGIARVELTGLQDAPRLEGEGKDQRLTWPGGSLRFETATLTDRDGVITIVL